MNMLRSLVMPINYTEEIPIESRNVNNENNINQKIIQKLNSFFTDMVKCLLSNIPIIISIIDFKKTSIFDYNLAYYKFPDDINKFKYQELNLYSNLHRITRIIKLASIIYCKSNQSFSSTKRELYYNDTYLFRDMNVIDMTISDICSILFINKFELPIFASSKGLFSTNAKIINSYGELMNIGSSSYSSRRINLLTNDYLLQDFRLEIKDNNFFILILEKETAFFNILNNDIFLSRFPNCLLVTGKGYPDYITKYFIHKLGLQLDCPFYYLGDNDSFGFDIYLNYLFGSKRSPFENEYICIPKLQWIGINSNLIDTVIFQNQNESNTQIFGITKLESRDYKKAKTILNKEFFRFNNWENSNHPYKYSIIRNLITIKDEIHNLLNREGKAEIEFILSNYPNFIFDIIESNLYSNSYNCAFDFNSVYSMNSEDNKNTTIAEDNENDMDDEDFNIY